MARKKRRFEQLQAAAATPADTRRYNDPLQDKVGQRLEDVGKKFEGKGRTILYVVGALILIVALVWILMSWSRRSSAAGQAALGKAIETSQAQISETGTPPGSAQRTYKTEKERAEAAITEFQAAADKHGGAIAEKAKYFIAVNKLFIDRAAGIQELESISTSNSEPGKMAKFALAQTRVDDNRLDEALKLYQDLAGMSDAIIAKDTLNFEIARIYEKQGKKQEAVDIYFNIAKTAAEAKDMDGKPVRLTQTATDAKAKVQELAPDRAKEIPEPTPDSPFGGAPIG
jgi:hypothetical protein